MYKNACNIIKVLIILLELVQPNDILIKSPSRYLFVPCNKCLLRSTDTYRFLCNEHKAIRPVKVK